MKSIRRYFKTKTVIHCDTYEKFEKAIKLCTNQKDFDSSENSNFIELYRIKEMHKQYGKDLCLDLWVWPKLRYSPIDYFEREEYNIIKFSDILEHDYVGRKFEVNFNETI